MTSKFRVATHQNKYLSDIESTKQSEGHLLLPLGLGVEQEEDFPTDSAHKSVDTFDELDVVLLFVGDGDVVGGHPEVLLLHSGGESTLDHWH